MAVPRDPLLLLIASALVVWTSVAAASSTSESFARVDTLFAHRQAAAAVALLDSLELVARRSRDGTTERQAVLQRGITRTQMGDAVSAEADLRRARELASTAGDSVSFRVATGWLGTATMFQGRLAEATGHYRQAIALARQARDSTVEGWSRTGLAYAMIQGGDLVSARSHYLRALELFRPMRVVAGELTALVGLGIVELQLGEFDAAATRYRDLIERSHAAGELGSEAQAWNNLGSIEFQRGDPAQAVEYYERAVAIHRRTSDVRELVTAQHNVAVAMLELGRIDDAVAVLDSARRECETRGFHEGRARVMHRLGSARLLQGRSAEALAYARQALEGSEGLSVELRARALGDLARALAALGHASEAESVLAAGTSGMSAKLGVRDRVDLDVLHADLLLGLGRPSEALARARSADREAQGPGLDARRLHPLALAARCEAGLGQFDRARATLREATAVWERQRSVPRDPEWRAERGSLGQEIFAQLALLELEHTAAPANERARAAFDLVQPFKARVLYERFTGVASSLSPALAPPSVTLAAVQRDVLRPGEVLLDAFLGSDAGVLFAVTREQCRAVRIPGSAALEPRIRALHDLLRAPGADGGAHAEALIATGSQALRDSLLGGVEALVRGSRLVLFAPDGPLNLIPLIGLERDVAVIPSVALLGASRARGGEGGIVSPSLVVVGGGADGSPAGASWEIARLKRRYDGVVAPHGLADGASGLAGQILHVAGHAMVDDQRPWRSGFAFGAGRDGAPLRLTAARIADHKLTARVAVLAGCESAGGRVLSGEGVQGLTGAFMGAGVPAVVASLWPVDDAATARLVEVFYAELARGRSAGQALGAAQRTIRRQRGLAHPFYWAGFVLVGDPDVTVRLRRRAPWREGLGVALAISAVVLFFVAFRRRRASAPQRLGP